MTDQADVSCFQLPEPAPEPAVPLPTPRRDTAPNLDFPLNRGVELLLPCQWTERQGRFTGERRLLVAVLQDALDTLAKPPAILDRQRASSWRDLRREAWDWVLSARERSPFDFVALCTHLNLDVDYLRSKLRRKYPDLDTLTLPLPRRTFNA